MTTAKLNAAYIKARKEIENPKLDSVNPHFNNKFASLKAVKEAVIPALLDQGIAVFQDLQNHDGEVLCFTTLAHESGEERTFGPFAVRVTKNDAQGQGSAATYAQRYTLMAIMGIVGDPDDDANAAAETHFKSKQMKTKYYNGLKAAAAEDDALKARELWDEMDNEQRSEIWADLKHSSGVRSTINRLLEETAPVKEDAA